MAAYPGYHWETVGSEEDATESSELFLSCTIHGSEFARTMNICLYVTHCALLNLYTASAISDKKKGRSS